MNENIFSNEEQLENDETRNAENLELDEATHEAPSFVEQNGDFKQAETIQNTLENLTDHETIDTSQLEYEPGPVQQPPDWDHGPPQDKVDLEDENTVQGRQPKMRGDLENLEPAGNGEGGKDEATPINLPGPVTAQTPEPGLHPFPNAAMEDESSGGRHAELGLSPDDVKLEETVQGRQPEMRGDLENLEPSDNGEEDKDEATPINLPGPVTAQTPEPGPHPFPNAAIEDDGSGGRYSETELSPDDVKLGDEGGRQ